MDFIYLFAKYLVSSLYVLALVLLCTFGAHRFYLARLFKKYKRSKTDPAGSFSRLPRVTIQLPVYNEMYVVERLIASVCRMDYPEDLLDIQVLDDSTDDTTLIAKRCVDRLRDLGTDITYIHRDNRQGYKAGALEEGLKNAKGEFIAIFDADFMPPPDFLKNTIHYFSDDNTGIVQTRWGHINRDYSLLTKVQSILLDGHFIIEQFTRFKSGVFLNFNGTAGIIRRKCIESSGGWQHDTLTEDLDLSYRAQLNGWKMVYLKDVVCNAELPSDMNAFKSQQHRWVKGGMQTAKKLYLNILKRRDLPLKVKSEAFFHLLGNCTYLLLLVLFAFMLPMGFFWSSIGWEFVFLISLVTISAGTLSVVYFYLVAVLETHGRKWIDYAVYIPVTLAVGVGLSVNNSKAILESIAGRQSEFRRTAKYAISGNAKSINLQGYMTSREITTVFELVLAVLFTLQIIYALGYGYVSWVPFLVLFQFGFAYTSLMSIFHSLRIRSV